MRCGIASEAGAAKLATKIVPETSKYFSEPFPFEVLPLYTSQWDMGCSLLAVALSTNAAKVHRITGAQK